MTPRDQITTLILDWGNTLCDYPLRTEHEQLKFLETFLLSCLCGMKDRGHEKSWALDFENLRRFNAEHVDGRVTPFVERARRILDSDLTNAEAGALEAELCARVFGKSQLDPDAKSLLRAAKAAGLTTAILSNTPWGTGPNFWRAEVEHHGFDRTYVDAVVFCGDCGFRKPNPAAFLACLNRTRATSSTAVMVGDNYASDILGAEAIGCRTVWIRPEVTTDEELRGPTRIVIRHLRELTRLIEKRVQIFWA
ncbi:HAD family hydrolase [Roseomonas gilardii]|uniref:HAD family hydrolase n=1 Tax=Roseomonas gilardii TaxID=257708 RepID=UPI0011A01A20|nr:HAD family hydrolase [Roseomonas gilardii]